MFLIQFQQRIWVDAKSKSDIIIQGCQLQKLKKNIFGHEQFFIGLNHHQCKKAKRNYIYKEKLPK